MTRHRTCNKIDSHITETAFSAQRRNYFSVSYHAKHIDIFAFIARARERTFYPSKPSKKRLTLYILKYITEENTVLTSDSNKLSKC